METTLNTLITLTFFAPMAILVAMDLLTRHTAGPTVNASAARRAVLAPLPPARSRVPANAERFLEAA